VTSSLVEEGAWHHRGDELIVRQRCINLRIRCVPDSAGDPSVRCFQIDVV
jgi:hypothetical protein